MGQPVREEVQVSELFPNYNNNRDRFDIVLPNLKVVIEVHGQQHDRIVAFGGDLAAATYRFQSGKKKDSDKEEIAILAGWTYMCFWYYEIPALTTEQILDRYMNNLNARDVIKPEKRSTFYKPTEEQKQKQRDYQKEQYRRMKEMKK